MTLTVVKLSLGKDCHYSGFSIKLFIKRLVVRLSFGKDCHYLGIFDQAFSQKACGQVFIWKGLRHYSGVFDQAQPLRRLITSP